MWKAAPLCRRRASDSAPSPVGRGRSWRQFLPCSGNHITGEAARHRGTELAPRFAVRILHVGNVHLVDPLRAHGHEVIAAFEESPALAVPGVPFDVRALWRRLPFAPDLLLVADTLGPQALPFGLEDVPVPRVYYAVDVHMNFFWQRYYARLFDLVLVAQKDYVPVFDVPARWLPWGADQRVFRERGLARVRDLVFAGTVDPATRPKRAAIVACLRERFGLETFGESVEKRLTWEEMGALFASSKIVLNEAILGDLNFRVFEAMACGAFLVTERIDNGLLDLFTPGEELAVYGPDDLIPQVAHYLRADAERARIAANGARAVRERHTLGARMAELSAVVEAGIVRRDVGADVALAWGMTAHLAAVRGLATTGVAVPAAARSLRAAADAGEAEAALGLAEILVWAGQHEAALAALAEARERDATLVRAWFVAAEVERRLGRPDAASELLRAGIGAAPDVTDRTRERALAAVDAGIERAEWLHALGLVMQEAGLPFTPGLVCQLDAGLAWSALDYFAAAVTAGSRAATESAARLFELVGLPDLARPFYETVVRLAPDETGAREDLRRILWKGYRHEEAAHQARVARLLAGGDVGDGTLAERTAAAAEAEAALGDAALARLEAGDFRGARCRLERALAIEGSNAAAIGELLALGCGVAEQRG